MGVAHYLVTISSSSLPWRIMTQIFFSLIMVIFAILRYKQNTDYFSLPNCKTRAMSLKKPIKKPTYLCSQNFSPDFSYVESEFYINIRHKLAREKIAKIKTIRN